MSSNLEKELNPKTVDFATTVNKSSKSKNDKLFTILDNGSSTHLDIEVNKFNPFEAIEESVENPFELTEKELVVTKKLTFFRKLINFFQNNVFIKKLSPMTEEDILHLKVKNKVISLIKTEDWTNLDKVIKAGFIITPHIQSMIDEKIERKYLIKRQFYSGDKEDEIERIGAFIFKYGINPSFISKNIIMKVILDFTQIFDVWYHEKERGWLGTQNYNIFLNQVVEITKNENDSSLHQILDKSFYDSSLKFTKKNIELSRLVNNFIMQNKEEFVTYFLNSLKKPVCYLKTNGEIGQNDPDYDLKVIIYPYNVIIKNIIKDLQPVVLKKVYDDFKSYLNEYKKKRSGKNSYLNYDQEKMEEVEKILEELQSVLGDEISDVKELLDLTTQLYGGSKTIQTNSFVIQEVFSIESLPSEIKGLYEIIKEKSIFIMNNQKEINSEDILFTQKIVKERIPKIIQKFMLFDDDDLKTMKNADGKSPQEICIETLKEIDMKFQYIIDTFKENNLSDLSAINRYVKKM